MRNISTDSLSKFREYLVNEEKSAATVDKYMRDVTAFVVWIKKNEIDKCDVLAYKTALVAQYALTSVNSMLSSLNAFFSFNEWYELKVKTLKIQRRVFAKEERELSKSEYTRLLTAAKQKSERLYLLLQTICSTGIRVSELRYVTVDAVKRGWTEIRLKGKNRTVFLPDRLCGMLNRYIRRKKITSGAVFVTRNGLPLDRSNIWSEMKSLCKVAGVSAQKVFPHNLRHLFAKTYYGLKKDIVRLADILGHSSVNTTRIYTMESGETHRRQIQRLGLLLC
ncbi:MAG: tyrosine-type recombinase/integrase [Clostridia bacterium]|nr:tyrosine-type recombinase/integrase [Clostridia bacterium]